MAPNFFEHVLPGCFYVIALLGKNFVVFCSQLASWFFSSGLVRVAAQ